MKYKKVFSVTLALFVSSIASTVYAGNEPLKGAVGGGALGLIIGGAAGKAKGAAIGGPTGLVAGAIIGKIIKEQRKKRRQKRCSSGHCSKNHRHNAVNNPDEVGYHQ